MRNGIRIGLVAASLVLGVALPQAQAQEFPSKPVTLILGYGAGGMTDTSSRIIANKLEEVLGVRVTVENKPGAGGTLAIETASQRPADGYTVVSMLSDSNFTASYQNRPIDLENWAIVGGYMPQQRVLFASPSAPFDTLQEFVDYAKENTVTFADGGAFWAARVVEAFAKQHGLNLRMVPFNSGAEGSAAILGGHVALAETGVGTSAWQAARNGELKIVATLTPGGLAEFGYPDVPVITEVGADYLVDLVYGYAVRGETPAQSLETLRAALKQTIEDPKVQEKLTKLDLTPEWITPESYVKTLEDVTAHAGSLREYLAK